MIDYRARAIAVVERLAEFMALTSTEAAERFADAVVGTVRRLHDSPRIGRPRRFRRRDLRTVRSWPVEGFPNHLIFYLARGDNLIVLRVIHGAQRIGAGLFDLET